MNKEILEQISMIMEDLREEIEVIHKCSTHYIKTEIKDLDEMIRSEFNGK